MIDQKTIAHIAKLARLHISDEEAKQFGEQLSKVLNHFEEISDIQTESIEPLLTPTDIQAFWREDVVKKDLSAEELTANAPTKSGNLFTVPPVV